MPPGGRISGEVAAVSSGWRGRTSSVAAVILFIVGVAHDDLAVDEEVVADAVLVELEGLEAEAVHGLVDWVRSQCALIHASSKRNGKIQVSVRSFTHLVKKTVKKMSEFSRASGNRS